VGKANSNNSAVYELWQSSIPIERGVSFEVELRDSYGNIISCNNESSLNISWANTVVYAEKLVDEYSDGVFTFNDFSRKCDAERSLMVYHAECSSFPLRGMYALHYELFNESLYVYAENNEGEPQQFAQFVIYSSPFYPPYSIMRYSPFVSVDGHAVYVTVVGRDDSGREVECRADDRHSFTVNFALDAKGNENAIFKSINLECDVCQGGNYNFLGNTSGIVTKAGVYDIHVLFKDEMVGSEENTKIQFSVGEFSSKESEIYYPVLDEGLSTYVVPAGNSFEIDIICRDKYGNNECCDNNPSRQILFFPYMNISGCHVSKRCVYVANNSHSVPSVNLTISTFTCSTANTFNITPCFSPHEYATCYSPFKDPLTVTVIPRLPSPATSYANITSLKDLTGTSSIRIPIHLYDVYSNNVSCDEFQQALRSAQQTNESIGFDRVAGEEDEVTPDFIKLYLTRVNSSMTSTKDISSYFDFSCISNNAMAMSAAVSQFLNEDLLTVDDVQGEVSMLLEIHLGGVHFTDITLVFSTVVNESSMTVLISTIMGFLLILIVILIFVAENYACLCIKIKKKSDNPKQPPIKPSETVFSSSEKKEKIESEHDTIRSVSDDSLSNICNWKLNPSEIRLYKAIGKGLKLFIYLVFKTFVYFCFYQVLQEKCFLGSLGERGLLSSEF
jgi:hypothetical protein